MAKIPLEILCNSIFDIKDQSFRNNNLKNKTIKTKKKLCNLIKLIPCIRYYSVNTSK